MNATYSAYVNPVYLSSIAIAIGACLLAEPGWALVLVPLHIALTLADRRPSGRAGIVTAWTLLALALVTAAAVVNPWTVVLAGRILAPLLIALGVFRLARRASLSR